MTNGLIRSKDGSLIQDQMNKKNPKIDQFLVQETRWRQEMEKLRIVCLASGLTEELKWGKPCYAFQGSNVVIIQGFKESCALMFCKGSLMKDPKGILQKPGESSQAARRIMFTSAREVVAMNAALKSYIHEAIGLEKAGLEVTFKKNPEPVPEELKAKWKWMPALKTAFEALTPGRQRGYILYFSAAKQTKTREARIEKWQRHILSGKGMND
jgi:uncharacterized protein YdeI (YjbR/CyaY-like superfamily)